MLGPSRNSILLDGSVVGRIFDRGESVIEVIATPIDVLYPLDTVVFLLSL